MSVSYVSIAGLILMSCCILYLAVLLKGYKTKLSAQNVNLIQLYLDKKFIAKLLHSATDVSKNTGDVIEDMLNDIKEYFNLEDAVIYNPDSKINKPAPGVYLRNIIAAYIRDHKKSIFKALEGDNVVVERIDNEKIRSTVYISSIPVANKRHVVAFVHSPEMALERHEVDTLARSIRDILVAAINLRGKSSLANLG